MALTMRFVRYVNPMCRYRIWGALITVGIILVPWTGEMLGATSRLIEGSGMISYESRRHALVSIFLILTTLVTGTLPDPVDSWDPYILRSRGIILQTVSYTHLTLPTIYSV